MLQVTINGSGNSEMFITCQKGFIGLTVVLPDGHQYDFNIENHEWGTLKGFIDSQSSAAEAIEADATMEAIKAVITERIELASQKKGITQSKEMAAFWDGQERCGQIILEKFTERNGE